MKVSVYAVIALAANMFAANAMEMKPEIMPNSAEVDTAAGKSTPEEHAAGNEKHESAHNEAAAKAAGHEVAAHEAPKAEAHRAGKKVHGKKHRKYRHRRHHHHAVSCESTIKRSRHKAADEATCAAERAYEGQWANRGVSTVAEPACEKKD